MGTDVHGGIEIKKDGRWAFVEKFDCNRNRETFALLSGVSQRFLDTKPLAQVVRAYVGSGTNPEFSDELRDDLNLWMGDSHNHGAVTAARLADYDFDKTVKRDPLFLEVGDEPTTTPREVFGEWLMEVFQRIEKLGIEYGRENARLVLFYDS